MLNVSVVIPTYNRADLIAETLESVLSQTYQAFEIIVVDDGSTDHTTKVLESYCLNPKIRVLVQANGGTASARNSGLRVATGDYICFLDSDDLWLPTMLETQVDVVERTGTVWSFSDVEWFQPEASGVLGLSSKLGIPAHAGYVAHSLIMGNFIPSPSVIVQRSVVCELGGYDVTCVAAEDWELWLRIAAKHPIEYVQRPLARYRVHSQSKTAAAVDDIFLAYDRYVEVVTKAVKAAPSVYARDEKRAVATGLIRMGRALANIGRLEEARTMFVRAARTDPGYLAAYAFGLATMLDGESYARLKFAYNKLQSILQ